MLTSLPHARRIPGSVQEQRVNFAAQFVQSLWMTHWDAADQSLVETFGSGGSLPPLSCRPPSRHCEGGWSPNHHLGPGRGEGCISNFEVALFAPLAAIERRRELGTSLRISMSVDLGSLLGNSSGVESFVMTSLLYSPEMWWKLAHLALAVLPEEAKAALNVLELTR